jgi:hypothetical protein
VVNGIMYIHTPFPNTTYAIDLDNPNKILWEHKPKQDASVRAVACCDVVNRGLAYGDGKIFKTQLDGHIVALDAKTGKELWKMENSDPKVGSTLTQAPMVVEDMVIVGSSGAELGCARLRHRLPHQGRRSRSGAPTPPARTKTSCWPTISTWPTRTMVRRASAPRPGKATHGRSAAARTGAGTPTIRS